MTVPHDQGIPCRAADSRRSILTSSICRGSPLHFPSSPLSPQWNVWNVSTSRPSSHFCRTNDALRGGCQIHHWATSLIGAMFKKPKDDLHDRQIIWGLLAERQGVQRLVSRSPESSLSQEKDQEYNLRQCTQINQETRSYADLSSIHPRPQPKSKTSPAFFRTTAVVLGLAAACVFLLPLRGAGGPEMAAARTCSTSIRQS